MGATGSMGLKSTGTVLKKMVTYGIVTGSVPKLVKTMTVVDTGASASSGGALGLGSLG